MTASVFELITCLDMIHISLNHGKTVFSDKVLYQANALNTSTHTHTHAQTLSNMLQDLLFLFLCFCVQNCSTLSGTAQNNVIYYINRTHRKQNANERTTLTLVKQLILMQ